MTDRPLTHDAHDLDRIRVRFSTFRETALDERTAFAASLDGVAAAERVILDTCHRVELVSVVDAPAPTAAGEAVGRDAVRRVFEVVAGFDSAVVAEEQLLGQARDAYETALAARATGPILNELFRRALRFGRRVRSHALPGTDRSLADRGATWLAEHVGPPSPVLVAGTGEMGRLIAQRLADAGHPVTLVSRSAERGAGVLDLLPGEGHRLVAGDLSADALGQQHGMALALRVREPVLTAALLDGARPWTLDLSTPAAVAEDAAIVLGERLLTLDRLGEIAGAAPVLEPRVERRLRDELEDEVEGFVRWLDGRRSRDALSILHHEADAVRRRHLERLRRRANLRPDQLADVEAAAAAMVGELLHGPTIELRRGGADADAVKRIFGLDA